MELDEKQLERAKKKLDELFKDPHHSKLLMDVIQKNMILGERFTNKQIYEILKDIQKQQTPLWKALNN